MRGWHSPVELCGSGPTEYFCCRMLLVVFRNSAAAERFSPGGDQPWTARKAVSQPQKAAETQGSGSVSATKCSGNTRQRQCLSHERQWKHKATAVSYPQRQWKHKATSVSYPQRPSGDARGLHRLVRREERPGGGRLTRDAAIRQCSTGLKRRHVGSADGVGRLFSAAAH